MSVQEICRVAENTQLGDGLFLMVLHAPKITELAQCGQFVHIACGEGHLLRRPISICAWKAPELRIVFQVKGEGTKWLSERRTGDELDVLGPLGHGFVTDVLKEQIASASGVAACGPKPMLKAIAAIAKQAGVPCQVSMEERMGCGIGACLVCACALKAKDGETRYGHVCKDGPVFNAEEVEW